MIEVYFDNIHNVIINEIGGAKKTIYLCVAWFTDLDVFNSLLNAQKRGVQTGIVIANHEFNLNSNINFKDIINANGSVRFIGNLEDGKADSLMHNKFCIIDSQKVITGSYNWTYKARKNKENIIIVEDRDTVKKFEKKYKDLNPKFEYIVNNNQVELLPIEHIMRKWEKNNQNKGFFSTVDEKLKVKINHILDKF
jgi:phosphatidylserine/phosphatidylglycerophosphate/cardiolipin synthase-like enzyme